MGAAMPTIPESGFTDGNGVQEFTQFTQQQMAALVRSGLDLDMVLNPFQMDRFSTTAEDRPPPELTHVKSVRNPIHIEPKSLMVIRKNDGYALQFIHTSTVPSFLTIYFMTMEVPDESGCPQFMPITNLESMYSRQQVLVQPQVRQTVTFPIPDAVVDSLISPSNLPRLSLPYLANADVNPSFQHVVIVLEPIEALQKPDLDLTQPLRSQRNGRPSNNQHRSSEQFRFGDEDEVPEQASPLNDAPASPAAREIPQVRRAKGFCTAEWLFIRLQPIAVQSTAAATASSSSSSSASTTANNPSNNTTSYRGKTGEKVVPSSSTDGVRKGAAKSPELAEVSIHDASDTNDSTYIDPGQDGDSNEPLHTSVADNNDDTVHDESHNDNNPSSSSSQPVNNNPSAIGVRSVRQSVLAARALYDLHEIFGLDSARTEGDSDGDNESKTGRGHNERVVSHTNLTAGLSNRKVVFEWDARDERNALLPVVPDCVICLTLPSDCVNLPCRHLCICFGCAERLVRQPIDQAKCPICRERLVSVTKLETVMSDS